MEQFPRLLLGAGLLLIFIALLWQVSHRWFPLGKLPGDVVLEKGPVKFFIPFTSALLLSLIISGVFHKLFS